MNNPHELPEEVITTETKMSEIAKKYGADFGSDNTLDVKKFLIKRGYPSLAKILTQEREMKGQKKELKIRPSIRLVVEDGASPFSIVAAHGRIVTPDEAKYLKEYEIKRKG